MEHQARYSVLHRSLNEVETAGGVDKKLAISNATIWIAMFMGTHFWGSIPLGVATHYFFRYVTRNEPLIIPIYMKWVKQRDQYDPWVHASSTRNERPEGAGKGNLC